jgi:hypothetical protein
MVDTWGKWTEEPDYKAYPQDEWCDLDYVANYIREQNYQPTIEMEELAERIIAFFNEADAYKPHYGKNLMINIPTLAMFVEDSGGIKEIDYAA